MNVTIIKISRFIRWARTENPAPQTTSRQTSEASSGFTLVEILIVLAIIAMVLAMGLPAISRVTYQRVNSTTRKFVGLVRTIKDDSILLNTIHRLVIDLDHQTYWVEEQRQFQLLSDEPIDARDSKKISNGKKGDKTSKAADPANNFQPDQKLSKEPIALPDGVTITGVLSERTGLIKQGLAYIHFFPNGYNEPAIIYMMRSGSKTFDGYSLVLRPVSGLVDIRRSYVQNFDAQ